MRSGAHQLDVYKIGRTQRDPSERARELTGGTGVPTPMEILARWEVGDVVAVETEAHRRLAKYRVNRRREFFRGPLPVIIDTNGTASANGSAVRPRVQPAVERRWAPQSDPSITRRKPFRVGVLRRPGREKCRLGRARAARPRVPTRGSAVSFRQSLVGMGRVALAGLSPAGGCGTRRPSFRRSLGASGRLLPLVELPRSAARRR